MKKSLIVALLVLFAVIGWFLSGQISASNKNSKNHKIKIPSAQIKSGLIFLINL